MSLRAEIEALRSELSVLAAEADTNLANRYALWHPPGQRRTLYRRFRKALGRLLRRWKLRPIQPSEPWISGLKHVPQSDGARPLVIWALDTEPERLRDACQGIERLMPDLAGWTPVLVTDVADFTFYSRLGWLVEYVPRLAEPGVEYRDRKARYLAWRYRNNAALPVSAGLYQGIGKEDLLID